MTLTRQVDLFHVPEIIGALILITLFIGVWRGKIKRSEPRLVFAASLALLPFVLFNQQLLTGRSMQSIHFDHFVANYAVLAGVVIVASICCHRVPNRALLWIAALCLLWGAIEIGLPAMSRSSEIVDDQMIPVLRRLKELSKHDGTVAGLRNKGKTTGLVFSQHFAVMRLLPTWTAQGTPLAVAALDFGSASPRERKELLYLYLYYCGADAGHLRELLNERTADTSMNLYASGVIFGFERVYPTLSLIPPPPIEQHEIEEEVRAYQDYAESFSGENALQHPFRYAVTRLETESQLSHIDRWYDRDAGERFGLYTLYRLKLRD